MIFLTMLLIPSIIALGFYLFSGKKITLSEFLIQNAIQLVVMGIVAASVGIGSTSDIETQSGRVASKSQERVSCSHSYRCNCYNVCSTDSKGNQSCYEQCSTCYEHSYDYDWTIRTTNGESIDIHRIDRQGVNEPPRFTSTVIGEPTAVSHYFVNYIKAAPDSLFRKQGLVKKFENLIPPYPGQVYDYYRLNRLVLVNGAVAYNQNEWNNDLSELNADLGRKKEVNIIVVLTKNLPNEYFFALEQAWIGAKQNDFTVVINHDDNGVITWTQVMALTQNKLAEVVVRDSILKLGTIERTAILKAIREGVDAHYLRKEMSDFEYLKNSIIPSTGMWTFSFIFGLIISIGLSILFMNNNYDDSDEDRIISEKWRLKVGTGLKVSLGLLAMVVIMALVVVSSVIGLNNQLVQQEAGLTAQYKQNQNNYDNMVKKVVEMAQVPSMAAGDLESLTKAAISGRYGADGSKAVFQFIQEQNPTVHAELYSKIQTAIESGRNSFEAEQKLLLDKKRIYETSLNVFPQSFVAKMLGFPRLDLAKIDIVTSNRTEQAFETKKDEPLKLTK